MTKSLIWSRKLLEIVNIQPPAEIFDWYQNGDNVVGIALFTTMPDISGNNYVEPSGASYERALIFIEDDVADFQLGNTVGGLLTYSQDILFPVAQESWGTIRGYGIFPGVNPVVYPDLASTPIYYNIFTEPKAIGKNQRAKIPANELSIIDS